MARLALPDPPLCDGVITLRGFESTDVASIVEICQDPEIPRWTLVPSPYGDDDARDYLTRVADGLAAGTRASFAIVDTRDGRLLGTTGLVAIDWDSACGEVGYMLAAPARGRGLASRTVHLLVRWSFETLGLERLELHIDRNNAASRAVAARTGFTRVAEPVLQRAQTAHFTDDIFFARRRHPAES
ncbi:MAG TPA: GNAT family N-acetyltransferase [Solirubrobacteraceae bacterium]|nr:GNAT family N-acetyltransferase [Solirubrobacteraceae bacterium]